MDNSSATEKAIASHWISDPLAYALLLEKNSRSILSNLIITAYRVVKLRSICIRLCRKFENDTLYSKTLRDILWRYHDVKIGNYTYGSALQPGVLPPGTCVGSYCSVGPELLYAAAITQQTVLFNTPFLTTDT